MVTCITDEQHFSDTCHGSGNSARDGIQGLMHARQVVYSLSVYFEIPFKQLSLVLNTSYLHLKCWDYIGMLYHASLLQILV